MRTIILTHVALAPGFMTNLVSLQLLNQKGVHWNSENPQVLTRNRTTFCNLDQIDRHWVLEKNASGRTNPSAFDARTTNASALGTRATSPSAFDTRTTDPSAFGTRKSKAPRKATFTGPQIHQILGHASLEVISY